MGAQKALAGLAVLHDVHPTRACAGRTPQQINLGELAPCADYTAQRVSIGGLVWGSSDFGEVLPLGDKLRPALSEGWKTERDQFVALHLATAYEWVLQKCTRRPPGAAKVRVVGSQLRQAEF